MTFPIRFEDHPRFQRGALHMTVAAGLAALAAHVAALLAPRLGGLTAPLPLATVAGAAVYWAAPSELRARFRSLTAALFGGALVAAALAAVERGQLSPAWGALIYAACIGFFVARGLAGRMLWVTAAAAAIAALGARFALGAIVATMPGPAWAVAAAGGLAFGLVALVGTVPRHLSIARLSPSEVETILARARAVQTASERAPDDPEMREAIRAEITRMGDVARRWHALERQAASSPPPQVLAERLAELEGRILAATDALARAEFERARDEVAQQLRDVEAIRQGRERIAARMHRALATVERMRLGAVGAEIDCASQAELESEEP